MKWWAVAGVLAAGAIAVAGSMVAGRARGTFAHQNDQAERSKDDSISGEWNAIFEVEGQRVPVVFKLKLTGNQVTGTVHSEHTGNGTVSNGSWSDKKLTLTFELINHQTIAVSGTLANGRLSGDYATEGRTGKWSAECDQPLEGWQE